MSKSYNGRLKAVKLKELRVRAQGPHVLPRLNKWRRGEAAKVVREFCEGIGIYQTGGEYAEAGKSSFLPYLVEVPR